jgi:DNA replication protein DnaD
MIIKKLFYNYNFNIDSLLMDKHKEMNLSTNEAIILLSLVSLSRKNNIFSLSSVVKKVDKSEKSVSKYINSLINKGFVSTYLEKNKENKTNEIFSLDGTFDKIEKILSKNKNNIDKKIDKKRNIVLKIEENIKRMLRPNELEELRMILGSEKENHDLILEIIDELKEKISIRKIHKLLLLRKRITNPSINEEDEKAIDELYRAIK